MTTRALQEASLLILTALAAGSRRGYGIIADVHQISGGRVRLRPGTLYTALDRLRADGLVGVDREEIVHNRLHRYYRLMPAASNPLPAREHPAAGPPDQRIGDADRESAAAALGEHFAQGRLTLDELMARLDAAFNATTRSEIAQTTRDLPHPPAA
jgi:DNA-binding PadR family transcriptional regulator